MEFFNIMKKFLLCIFASFGLFSNHISSFSQEQSLNNNQFSVTSKSFENEGTINNKNVFKGFGCFGGNLSPQLSWNYAPEDTKSFAITMFDPDAPTGSGWWHWGVFNIAPDIKSIEEGASSKNRMPFYSGEIFTDFGSTGYGGPCPPEGDKPHRYIITVYALNVEKLDLSNQTTTGALLSFMLKDATLAKASITGYYSRDSKK
jgi:Raf kinase inhibitor-like YbhB/YbcL family protein